MRESEQAREIARLQEAQATLAHDVHDVVGHSLAVILAQAETGPYLDDPDATVLNEKLRRTMATIAESARASLGDVRRVLVASRDQSVVVPTGGLDALVASVERSGQDVRSSVAGQPRPLPPELESVAYRVLQEMLTNAMRHGRRDAPIWIERHWPDEHGVPQGRGGLQMQVRNLKGFAPQVHGGLGVIGMRTRLESVGGHLDVQESQGPDGQEHTVTAWVPVRDEAS
ncbi:sensor histidine kinase [Aeromicrobium sp. UC242_57]|uniref:sensor histidine kinase n=1 Tax=Aeromicrobium sp. UC242_57 TaxID=3374624 RepID=UPI00379ECB0F